MVIRTNYSSGYIVEYNNVCFDSWLLLPAENLWPKWLRGVLYTLAMLYIFLGIAIAADVFMLSIEMITSKKRIIFTFDYEKKQRIEQEVFIWNETVANLTLMALGSSAPEILIAVIETVSTLDSPKSSNGLGIFTIIGSASYNLLVITAVCIITVPSNTTKRVMEFGVFVITSIWSMFAYVWILIVLKWSSPNEVEIWEAILTLFFFPLLVLTAWAQDKGWWCHRLKNKKHMPGHNHHASNSQDGIHHSPLKHIVDVHPVDPMEKKPVIRPVGETCPVSPNRNVSEIKMKQLTDSRSKIRDIVSYVRESSPEKNVTAHDVVQGLKQHFDSTMSRAFARARFRHAVVVSITGQRRIDDFPKHNEIISKAMIGNNNNSLHLSDLNDTKTGSFSGSYCFSSATYSVSRKSTTLQIDVLFNRRKRSQKIGFSHIVEAAQKISMISTRCLSPRQKNSVSYHEDSCVTPSPTSNTTRERTFSNLHSVSHTTTDQSGLPEVSECDELSGNTYNDIENSVIFSNQHSNNSNKNNMNNSNSLDSPRKKRILSQQENEHVTPRHIKMSQISRHLSLEKRGDISDHRDNGLLGLASVAIVRYETREGHAKAQKDFAHTAGALVFSEDEYCKRIYIPIINNSNDDEDTTKDFYVVLKDPCPDTALGDPTVAHVSFMKDNDLGEFIFQEATYHVEYTSHDTATATAKVVRLHGSDGNITVYYRTINGTAMGGDNADVRCKKCDFEHVDQGVLNFASGETSKKIVINVQSNAEMGKTFIIALYHVTGSGKIGHRCAAIISLTSEVDEIVDQVTSLVSRETENTSVMQEWRQQILDAMSLDGSPSGGTMFLHFLCFLWKVLFSFIPPRTVWGGWAAFIVSLLMLGLLAAFVEQFAKLLGCVIGLDVSITGITLVALGTSMPDTFASKTAALQDDSADAAIGNITGSNSVNVFLGLGLPWVLKSIYLRTKGSKLILNDDNLMFSAVVFLSCGSITLVILVVRRMLFKGELGGGACSKYASGCVMVSLWLLFVALCSLKATGTISAF